MSLLRGFFAFFYEIIFGCRHDRLTRPFTIEAHTYKVCLDCGKQVFYSAETMRPLSGREVRRMNQPGRANLIPLTARLRRTIALRSHRSKAAA